MRYTLFFLLGCCFSVFNTRAQVTDSVQAFYSFYGNANNGLGTGVDDFQLVGTPQLTTDRFGNVDCAYEFPGDQTNYLSIPNPSSNIDVNYTNGWSISLWYQGGSSAIGDLEHIFRQGTDTFICNQISIYDLNKPVVEVFDFNTSNPPLYVWADDIQSNVNYYMDSTVWHHIVLSVKPNNFMNLYVDNVLQSESLTNPNMHDYCGSPIELGKSFQGKIDDIAIYHKALNLQEVDTLFNMQAFCMQSPLGMSDYDVNTSIEIYPNPANNQMTLTSNKALGIYKLINVLGQEVLTGLSDHKETSIDVGHLPEGLYYLTTGSASNTSYKVVITH